MLKDANPGCLDLSFGGVFGPDEDHHLNAKRELKEELNLDTEGLGFTFRYVGCRPYCDRWTDQFAYIFALNIYDERVLAGMKLQETEVDSVMWLSRSEIDELFAKQMLEPGC